MTHRLALYLESEFPGWDVDCEYNRLGDAPKKLTRRLSEQVDAADTDAYTVFPDIVVHRRGEQLNLLVIEAKKLTSSRGLADDETKLLEYQAQFGYLHAALVVFATGRPSGRSSIIWRESSDAVRPRENR